VRLGFNLLEGALGRKDHMVKPIYARLAKVIRDNIMVPTTVILDLFMCPSNNSYFCDLSPTMDQQRPYFEAAREGKK
jgi:hypothetical protein